MKTTIQDTEETHSKVRQSPQGKNSDRATLTAIAHRAMIERGLEPEFSPKALQELAAIQRPADATDGVRDLRDRLWASIDNDNSRDLDQLTVAESLAGGESSGSWMHWSERLPLRNRKCLASSPTCLNRSGRRSLSRFAWPGTKQAIRKALMP